MACPWGLPGADAGQSGWVQWTAPDLRWAHLQEEIQYVCQGLMSAQASMNRESNKRTGLPNDLMIEANKQCVRLFAHVSKTS